ncbi:MAG TPA: hypothetical protein V6D27_01275 [Vampirovibrionales bacterium]
MNPKKQPTPIDPNIPSSIEIRARLEQKTRFRLNWRSNVPDVGDERAALSICGCPLVSQPVNNNAQKADAINGFCRSPGGDRTKRPARPSSIHPLSLGKP